MIPSKNNTRPSDSRIGRNASKQEATWLLSRWGDSTWIMESTGDTPRVVDGIYAGVARLPFDATLPNGDLLTHSKYGDILEDIKRVIYYSREGLYGGRITRSEQQYRLGRSLISLVTFMILEELASPTTYLTFSSLTPSHFRTFCERAAMNGRPGIEKHHERIQEALTTIDSEVPSGAAKSGSDVLIEDLSKRTHIPTRTIRNNPQLIDLIDTWLSGLPPAKNPRYTEARQSSESNTHTLISCWDYICRYSDELLHPLRFQPFTHQSPIKIVKSLGAEPKGRTPTIPRDIALCYLNEAIRWLIRYGRPLVEYKNLLDAEVAELRSGRSAGKDYYAAKAFSLYPPPKELSPLGLTRANAHAPGTPIDTRRTNLSVQDACQCLTAACYILFATFTARRKNEILYLEDSDVVPGPDGWDVDFGLLKGSSVSRLDRLSRPIPELLAYASEILLSSHKLQRNQTEDEMLSKRLFVANTSRGRIAPLNYHLNNYLDFFAITNDPGNAKFGAWTLRSHQFRRFFAISYFRHKSDHNLDALSWFLGHLDPDETRTYITEVNGSMEFDAEEREFIKDAITTNNTDADVTPIEKHIARKFNTDKIEFIEPDQLDSYIDYLIESGHLDIRLTSFNLTNTQTPFLIEFLEPRDD